VAKKTGVGRILRQLRTKQKLGIKSAAPRVGVSYSYLSKIENDLKTPSIDLISKLCELYEGDVEEIMARLGSLPPDVQRILQTHGKDVFLTLRKTYSSKKMP